MKSRRFLLPYVTVAAAINTACATLAPTYTMSASYPTALVEVSRPKETKARWGAMETIELGDSSRYVYADSMVRVLMAAGRENIQFAISNKTDHSIKIIWDEASFVGVDGKVSKVMHIGTKFADREQPQAPSVIPSHQTLEDGAWPNDRVWFSQGYYSAYYSVRSEWKHVGLILPSTTTLKPSPGAAVVPDASFTSLVKANVGKRFALILPLQIEGVTNEYTFWFKVTDATITGPSAL